VADASRTHRKGTGSARAGSTRSPIWVGGGARLRPSRAIFRRRSTARCIAARMRAMFSELVRQDRLLVTDAIALEAPKTKLLANHLKSLSLGNVLIIVEAIDEKLFLAARNLPGVEVLAVGSVNPVSLAAHDKVLATVGAVKLIEERLQ
jgi:large subunit ribosomal protein L4